MNTSRRMLVATFAVAGALAGGWGFVSVPALAAAPEEPVTMGATSVTGTSALLNGELNPGVGSERVKYRFAYSAGGECTSGFVVPGEPFPEAEGNHAEVSAPVSGLQPNAKYSVCLIATNALEETALGNMVSFTTLPFSKPVVDGESESGVTPFDAVLEARVNAENQATTWHFEYSRSNTLAGAVSVGEGSFPGVLGDQAAGPVDIGGSLEPETSYFYRVVATNATGTTQGPIQEFKTPAPVKPVIEGESASEVTQSDARLHAVINPSFQATRYQFRLGTDTSYTLGGVLPAEGELGAGFGGQEVGVDLHTEGVEALSNLKPDTEYHYEVVATNATGSSEGLAALGDETFLTLPDPPAVATGEATGITPRSARINATVNPEAQGHPAQDDTTYLFQYSADESFSTQTPLTPGDAGEGTTPVPVHADLEGLEPATTYHYRIVAANNNDKTSQQVLGEARTFTTVATPPALSGAGIGQITQSSAVIAATLDTRGLPTRWALQLATNPATLQPTAAGNSSSPEAEPIGVQLENLQPNTTYYYRLTAENPDGAADTGILAFTTSPPSAAPQTTNPYSGFPLLSVPPGVFPVQTGTVATAPKSLTSAQKLRNALNACHKKHNKRKRARCEREAHKKHPAGGI